MKPKIFDVVIAGGGLVGACLAKSLCTLGLNTALLDRKKFTATTDPTEIQARVSAINLASVNILKNLQIWPRLLPQRCFPFRQIHTWDSAGTGRVEFDAASIGQDCLGYIIENNHLLKAIFQSLQEHDNFTDLSPCHAESFQFNESLTTVQTSQGPVCAKLLVAADGQHSQIRQWAGISVKTLALNHHALVSNITTEYSHGDIARQRFLAQGPLAFLPLGPQQCSIVWSTTPTEAEKLLALNATEFHQTLAEASEGCLGHIKHSSARYSFPLASQYALVYVNPRLALVGDAAHTIHPLAGQGANLGLLDVACLTEILRQARLQQRDIGDYSVLRKYARWRSGDNFVMLKLMHNFKQMFTSQIKIIQQVRNLGFSCAHHSPLLKQFFIRQAVGFRGEQPPLAHYPDLSQSA